MDRNRAVIALIVIVFVIVIAMLYVLFTSSRKNTTNLENLQTFEEGYAFDIDNDINNRTEDEEKVLITETITKKDNEPSKKTEPESKTIAKINESPETGPGSIAVIIALVLGMISAGVVYKKEAKTQR